MSLEYVERTGRGFYRARLSPAGWPYEFVSDASMEKTTADGRIRIAGLELGSIQLDVRADIARAKIESDGFVAKIQDKRGRKASAALGRRPSIVTWLRTDLTRSGTTAAAFDTSQWPNAGQLFIATEAFAYASKTGGGTPSFNSLTRGLWDTETDTGEGQAHYIADGAGLSYPKITDWPETMEGRRVRLYLYGPGDDPQGEGTLRWTGVASTDVSEDGLGRWSFSIDPLTKILDQDIGGDLEDPVPIRGATYPWNAPLRITITNVTLFEVITATVIGHFDDPAAFATEVAAQLNAAVAANADWTWANGSSFAVRIRDRGETGVDGWDLLYQVGDSGGGGTLSQLRVQVLSLIDAGADDDSFRDVATGVEVGVPDDDALLYCRINARWPRGVAGLDIRGVGPGTGPDIDPDGVADIRRVYLGGTVVPTGNMAVMITEPGAAAGSDPSQPLTLFDVDAATRSLLIGGSLRVLNPDTRIQLGRVLARGNVTDLRDALVTDSPDYCNAGGGPLIVAGDIAASAEVDEAAAVSAVGNDRVFVAFTGAKLADIIENELRAIGCFQRISASGAIEWKKLRVTTETDEATWTITARDILSPVPVDRSDRGVLTEVLYKTGWDPTDDKFKGPDVRPRDVSSSSPNRAPGVLKIERRSVSQAVYFGGAEALNPRQIADAVAPVLGFYGSPYDVLTFQVGPRFSGMLVGDTVAITHPRVPGSDGARGVTGVLGFVVRTMPELGTGRITVGVHLHGQRFAGYAPSFPVASYSLVGGNTYDLTLTLSPYTSSATIARWFAAGDLLRVTEFDDATPTELAGAVDSIQSATVARVTFVGAWTPGTAEWIARPRASTSYDEGGRLGDYVYQAEETRIIDYATTDRPARVQAP